MSYTKIIEKLRSLKLHGMLESFSELSQQPGFNQLTKENLLDNLLSAELADRTTRSINYQMGVAKFPISRDLNNFDFLNSEVNEEQIKNLHDGHFINEKRNIVFVGGTGTGKSHLATAIASQAKVTPMSRPVI